MTGVFYDPLCLLHRDEEDESVEKPERCSEIFAALKNQGLLARCRRVEGRMATKKEVCSIHTAPFYRMIQDTQWRKNGSARLKRNTGIHLDEEKDTYFNDYSFKAASLSCGGLLELTSQVVQGKLKNGFAIIRPPGHHAEKCKAMGFCLFNHIAITAKLMRQRYDSVQRILIVDWDVHHGNGTQKSFEADPDILYFSIHRYDGGSFFPGTGSVSSVGKGAGAGKTVNVPLPTHGFGDSEYLQIFEQVLLPIAREFSPDLVLVSAGFDSAYGDIGEMKVTENGFGQMTSMLVNTGIVEDGKIVVALEGGYNLKSLVPSALSTVKVLLGDRAGQVPSETDAINFYTWAERKRHVGNRKRFMDVIARVMSEQSRFWTCFSEMLPLAKRKTRNDTLTTQSGSERNQQLNFYRKFVESTTCEFYAGYLGRKVNKLIKGEKRTGYIVERQFLGGKIRWMIHYDDDEVRATSHIAMVKSLIETEEAEKQRDSLNTKVEKNRENAIDGKHDKNALDERLLDKIPKPLPELSYDDFDVEYGSKYTRSGSTLGRMQVLPKLEREDDQDGLQGQHGVGDRLADKKARNRSRPLVNKKRSHPLNAKLDSKENHAKKMRLNRVF
eukprot:CAMPEP_0197539420 /NCGR_PEP_ID=MMETSP1318-20131121/62648_1 /TAXON_ID=552666 /ORGANISM="Partenskyella glossopodia, Strain RCC365" /LENGTH=610 /DNA_ID=CAMNT_0043098139 /DNA_START=561 /DNA_END=2393 /DNA_ORIENTATION=+